MSLPARSRSTGFTLIELLVTVALVAVLFMTTFAGYKKIIQRMDLVACQSKMKNLGAGFKGYMLDHGNSFPEEPGLRDEDSDPSEDEIWEFYYNALKDYGITRENWFCPVEIREAKKADKEVGVDDEFKDPSYVPTPMMKEDDPYQYATLPWFMERSDFHGMGRNKYMGVDGTIQREINLSALKSAAQ